MHECCLHGIFGDGLHLWENRLVEIRLFFLSLWLPGVLSEIFLKLAVGKLISLLVLAVVLAILLDGVVGEVSVEILAVFVVVLEGRCPDVSFVEPVALKLPIHACHQHEMANVELPFVVEQGFLDVPLEDECSQFALRAFFSPLQPNLDIIERRTDSDTFPSVGELSRLQNPNV